MGSTFDAPEELDVVDHIKQTRDSYSQLGYAEYRWADNEPDIDLVTPAKPLSECTVGLIASGGLYVSGQVAFHHKDDVTRREVPTNAAPADLRISHFAYDPSSADADPNVVFPLEPLRALVDDGTIAGLTSHALTFMGGIYSQRRVREELIPGLVERMHQMAADIVLLVPV